jgi:hypothetical protein
MLEGEFSHEVRCIETEEVGTVQSANDRPLEIHSEGLAQVEMRVILEVSPPGKLLPNLLVWKMYF